MNFASDNTAAVAPRIMAALAAANSGAAMPYGNDEVTRRLERRFAEIFDCEVAVFPVATGTAANALALAAMTPPWGAVYCHPLSHIATDECGAPEFFAGGAKLGPVAGEHGKIAPEALAAALEGAGAGVVHHMQPAALSLTNESEAGTVYSARETAALAAIAHKHGLSVHVDGARFANAVAALGITPAELTWRCGVDALSFGATKGGAMAAEAAIFFTPALAENFGYRRKRAGHLFSKMRFLSVQLEAYLEDGLWLADARHANAMAARLGKALAAIPGVTLLHPVEGNEIFARLPEAAIAGAFADGFAFYRRGAAGAGFAECRFVCAFSTEPAHVEGLAASLRRHAAGAA
jgi:threonine aldolase